MFEETGFLEARISDIAERAGLSHGILLPLLRFEGADLPRGRRGPGGPAHRARPTTAEAADADERSPSSTASGAPTAATSSATGDNGKIMGVIEEVSRYDDHVNEARMRRQKHFADRAERAIRRLQEDGAADPDVDPEIAALALGSMVARVAELWLVEHWGDYDLDTVAEQVTRLWANAIGLKV